MDGWTQMAQMKERRGPAQPKVSSGEALGRLGFLLKTPPTPAGGGPLVEVAAAANLKIAVETMTAGVEATTVSHAEEVARLEKRSSAAPRGSLEDEEQSTSGFGLRMKHTTRFRWRNMEAAEDFPDRPGFIREVIFRKLGLAAGQVVCVKKNGPQRFVDVTALTNETYQKVIEISKKEKGLQLKQYKIEHLWWMDRRIITVHIFNPFVPAEDVYALLQHHVNLLLSHGDIQDEFGIWNKCRQFQGFVHPPAYFNICGSTDYLFYQGQHPFCCLWWGRGHTKKDCKDMRCWRCLESGHLARDCIGLCCCSQCGGEGHLFCNFPQCRPPCAGEVLGSAALGAG
uniref:CCHC-type domain-containing protein n=1 Tax=Scleropages formosus TaxID=113540 RepID=A0A8C9R939_SCLFO